jgi:diguanylate cyclase (GGDEF)-like protein
MQTAVATAARHVVVRLREHLAREGALTRAAVSLLAAAVLAIGITLWDLRQIVIADALVNTDNLAIVLADETSHSVQAVDIVLRDIQERIAAQGVTTPEAFHQLLRTREMHDFLRSRVDRLSQVDNIVFIAADGVAVNDAFMWPTVSRNVSDRDYVRHFAQQDDPGLFISEPLTSRGTGRLSVSLVRRVNGPHGEFLGMVLGSVSVMMLHELYDTINLPPSESVMLLRRDGTVLARHPDPIDRSGTKMPPDSPWYAEAERGGGHYESFGVFDKTIRLVSVWPLRDYPLVLDVALNEDAALAHWRREAIVIGLGTAIALGFMLLMLYRLRLQFHRLEASKSILTVRNADLTRSAEALRASETSLAAISRELETTLSSMDQGLIMVDAAGQIAVCNRRAIEMLGLSAPLMAQRPFLQAVPALQWVVDALDLTGSLLCGAVWSGPLPVASYSCEHELPTGIILEVGWVPVAGSNGWVVTFQDITARRRAEAEVAFVARHDALTRLPNRVMFRERIELAIAQTERAIAAAVLFLDLDHFKAVNDTLGHPTGDDLLRMVADRLESCVRQVDMVSRFGGDEFGVIQSGPERIEDVAVLAQRITDVLSMPYQLDDHLVTVGVSIGIALVPADGSDPDTLLKHADIALYRAKAEGRGVFRLFEPAMDARLHERRVLELDLRHALAHGSSNCTTSRSSMWPLKGFADLRR